MQKNKNKKGFTFIEVMMVMAIIGVLAAIILISISTPRKKAQGVSVLQSMRSAANIASACMMGDVLEPQLSALDSAAGGICLHKVGGVYVPETNFPDWPDVTKHGWEKQARTVLGQDGFYWCSTSSTGSSHPTVVGMYSDGSIGGDSATGSFCYMLKNDDKYIWCMQDGCHREGF